MAFAQNEAPFFQKPPRFFQSEATFEKNPATWFFGMGEISDK
jgi:hypothetical protein